MLDQHRLESVQKTGTRLVTSIKHLTYEQRIQMLKLDASLRYRWQQTDIICVYSLFNNIYDLDYSLFFTLAGDTPTRGHSFKLFNCSYCEM